MTKNDRFTHDELVTKAKSYIAKANAKGSAAIEEFHTNNNYDSMSLVTSEFMLKDYRNINQLCGRDFTSFPYWIVLFMDSPCGYHSVGIDSEECLVKALRLIVDEGFPKLFEGAGWRCRSDESQIDAVTVYSKAELEEQFRIHLRNMMGDCFKDVYISDEQYNDEYLQNTSDACSVVNFPNCNCDWIGYRRLTFTIILSNDKEITLSASDWAQLSPKRG